MSSLPRDVVLKNLSDKLGVSVCVAKPSENLYLGKPVGKLSAFAASIVNLASHGEMSVSEVVSAEALNVDDSRLINLLPTKLKIGASFLGDKRGRYLNHFGYRKQVMNLVPETLLDHAWIACALSYSCEEQHDIPFDRRGGGIAGGVAAITKQGTIFRGSGVADAEGIIVSPTDSLEVSLLANAESNHPVDVRECLASEFLSHRFLDLFRH